VVLVDTSVWIDHFRRSVPELVELLEHGEVWVHPFVTGEIACGALQRRRDTVRLLELLPQAPLAEHEEVLGLLERERLWGRGIGWIDLHLLASARLAAMPLWTRDRRLLRSCDKLRISYRS
jgi:predicted nucleic acid-binding protein